MTRSVRTTRGRVADQRIIPAAVHVFVTKGFRGTSMEDIAAEAGMGRASLFRWYTSKNALFVASLKTAVSTLVEPDDDIAGGGESGDVPPNVALVWSFLRRVRRDPAPWLLYEQATTMPEFAEQVDELRHVFIAHLAPAVQASLEELDQEASVALTDEVVSALEVGARMAATGELDVDSLTRVADLSVPLVDAQGQTPDPADGSDELRSLIERARVGIADGWAEAIDRYGVLGAGEISEMSDSDRVTTERQLLRQARSGELIALSVNGVMDGGGAVVFPKFQFDQAGSVLPVMSDIAARVAERWDVETRLLWLTSPNGWLGAQTPADLLATQPDAVLRALDLAIAA